MLKNRPQVILINAIQREIAHNDSMVLNDSKDERPCERMGQVGEKEREKQRDKKER